MLESKQKLARSCHPSLKRRKINQVYPLTLKVTDTLSREATLSKLILLPFEKRSTLKGKASMEFCSCIR